MDKRRIFFVAGAFVVLLGAGAAGYLRYSDHALQSNTPSEQARPPALTLEPQGDSANAKSDGIEKKKVVSRSEYEINDARGNKSQTGANPVRSPTQDYSKAAAQQKINEWIQSASNTAQPSPGILMHKHFEQEPIDPEWAPAATSEIQQFSDADAANLDSDFHMVDVSCRSTMCQIEAIEPAWLAQQNGGGNFQGFVNQASQQGWFGGFSDVHTSNRSDGNGQIMIIGYFIRQPGP